MIAITENLRLILHYAKRPIDMVQRASQLPDACLAQNRSDIDTKTRSENNLRRVLTHLGTLLSAIAPFLWSSSLNNSTKKPVQAYSLIPDVCQLKGYPVK